jgi:dimeric dUTPase (all-alpha-NTP-PPase superfamily)
VTTVVHCRQDEFDTYIGRPSKWGNPFKSGVDGNRREVIAMYRSWIQTQIFLMWDLHELKGKRLGCWCKTHAQPNRACHGDVLVELVNKYYPEEKEMPTAGDSEMVKDQNFETLKSGNSAAKVALTEKAIEGLEKLESAQIGAVPQPEPDMLRELFRVQAMLNNKIFAKQGINFPNTLTMAQIKAAVDAGDLGPSSLPNTWMRNYLWALTRECSELDDKLLKKWWSKDQVDLQQSRVEIIDQLHFWLSLAMASGMTADDVFRIYMAKLKVNEQRQDQGYSAATKVEDDKHIK